MEAEQKTTPVKKMLSHMNDPGASTPIIANFIMRYCGWETRPSSRARM